MKRLTIAAVGVALVVGVMALFPAPSIAAAQITEIIDSTGDGAGNTLDESYGIAVDGNGNVYVAGYGSDNAFKITAPLPVGGIAELPAVAGPTGASGMGSGTYAVLAGAVSGVLAFAVMGILAAKRRGVQQ